MRYSDKVKLINHVYQLRQQNQLSVHETPTGVWEVDLELIESIAELEFVDQKVRSIETGIGLSTIIFCIFGFKHTCIVPDFTQVRSIKKWMKKNNISYKNTKYVIDYSFNFKLDFKPKYDLILIDGNHGFPHPILDYFILSHQLKLGGYLIIDDINLNTPGQLDRNLSKLKFWVEIRRSQKWVIYKLIDENLSFLQEWTGAIETKKITRLNYYYNLIKKYINAEIDF